MIALAGLLGAACTVGTVAVQDVQPGPDPVEITTPVKAHLVDGSTIVFEQGARVAADTVWGAGRWYAILPAAPVDVMRVPLDSVAAMESFQNDYNEAASTLLSLGTAAAVVVGTAALYKALFGSCPTFYGDSSGVLALEAEGFSYSIAPMYERRDVDALASRPDATGALRLELRNEALETHYINHLELLEVAHAEDEVVLPDGNYHVLAAAGLAIPPRVTDRSGRDVRPLVAGRDSLVFASAAPVIERATADDFHDWIDIDLPAPPADSVAIVLEMRNSLLNTVLLYEGMLGAAGARAVDWLGGDLATIDRALELAHWYGSRMGMRVAVRRGNRFEDVAYVPDAGPIAWRRVAAVVPVPAGDSLHLRLRFVADQWRIDRVAIAPRFRRVEPRVTPLAAIVTADGVEREDARDMIVGSDDRYLVTRPGERFALRFDVGVAADGGRRTYLLASQGYYTEWIRTDWIRSARAPRAFAPSDSALVAALARWHAVRPEFEQRFYSSRIPVR